MRSGTSSTASSSFGGTPTERDGGICSPMNENRCGVPKIWPLARVSACVMPIVSKRFCTGGASGSSLTRTLRNETFEPGSWFWTPMKPSRPRPLSDTYSFTTLPFRQTVYFWPTTVIS
jgi:hypothetical protein